MLAFGAGRRTRKRLTSDGLPPAPEEPPTPPDTSRVAYKPSTHGNYNAFKLFSHASEWPATTGADLGKYDVIQSNPFKLSDTVINDLRAANPDAQLLSYFNLGENGTTPGGAHADSFYSRNAEGNFLRNVSFANLFLADPLSTGWASNRYVGAVAELTGLPPTDGVWADVLGPGPVLNAGTHAAWAGGVLVNGTTPDKPRNAATSADYTIGQWVGATGALAGNVGNQLRAGGITGAVIAGNGLGYGDRYFGIVDGPTKPLIDSLDAATAELFIRTPSAGISSFRSATQIRRDIDMIVDSETTGVPVLCITKVWVAWTTPQREQWRMLSLAAFLLGTQGRSAWEFIDTNPFQGGPHNISSQWADWYADKDLGPATEQYRAPNGGPSPNTGVTHAGSGSALYTRGFANGLVLMNISAASVVYALPQTYTRIEGGTVSGNLTVPAMSGVVLLG